jgi:hypothetical protein
VGHSSSAKRPSARARDRAPRERRTVLPRPPACLNCDAPTTGAYCAACGQRAEDRTVGLRLLITDGLEDLVNLDGRVFRTFRELLLRPGFVSAEYVRGRRARYFTPFRTYLAASLACFLVTAARDGLRRTDAVPAPPPRAASPLAGVTLDLAERGLTVDIDPDVDGEIALGPLRVRERDLRGSVEDYDRRQAALSPEQRASPLERATTRNAIRMTHAPEVLAQRFVEQAPKMMSALVPVHAALLALFYHRRRRFFAEHLVLSLHQHALVFVFLTIDILIPSDGWGWMGTALDGLVASAAFLHLVASLRTFHGEGWLASAAKLLGIGLLYVLVLGLVGAMTLVLTLFFA